MHTYTYSCISLYTNILAYGMWKDMLGIYVYMHVYMDALTFILMQADMYKYVCMSFTLLTYAPEQACMPHCTYMS